MNYSENTDETFGALLRDTLDSEVRPEIETRLREQLAQLQKRFDEEGTVLPQRSDVIARSFIAKAILGMTCAAVIVYVCFILLPSRMPTVSAATVEAIRAATSMICEITVERENQDPLHHTVRWVAPDRIRADYGFTNETWWVEGDRVTVLYHDGPFATVTVNMPRTSEPLQSLVSTCATPDGLAEALKNSELAELNEVERSESNGAQLVRLEKKDKGKDVAPEMLIDHDSRLPVEVRYAHDASVGRVSIIQRFAWNVPIDEALMIPQLPEGLEPRIVDGSKGAFPHDIRPGDGVGPIRLGMSKEEVYAVWGKPDKTVGTHNNVWQYFDHGVDVPLSDRAGVWQIGCVLSETMAVPFKTFTGTTPEGIGIGATEEEIIDALGQPDSRTTHDHGIIALQYNRGIKFTLQSGWVKEWGDEARVHTILVRKARSSEFRGGRT